MAITGDLVFANVTELVEAGKQHIQESLQSDIGDAVEINCSELQRIDSAGIASLLEWQRQCGDADKACRFVGLTEQAESLIQAYRLQTLISAQN